MVAKRSIEGNAEKSSGLEIFTAIIMITNPTTILNVKRTSNSIGGRGNTNIVIINKTSTGMPRPEKSKLDKS
tara:strand:- start:110 stop:325 length:216 start_codon:yes stop_codon:yes gene_type:complete